ncbi:MAG: electron transport complex subunit RsxC [Bacteroidales bacterium]
MSALKTFRSGGVHPPENKLSENSPIEVFPLPKQVSIPVNQNLGAPAVPLVNKGDVVKAGQMIAKGEAFISSNVHSSVSGKVLKIDDMIDHTGYKRKAVVINVDGDEWETSVDRGTGLRGEITLTREEIIKKIHEMGVVGMGGATFPSHVKLMVPEGKKPEYLIINGVECEPYLTADHRLMLEKGEEILVGTQILMKGLGVEKAIIGIENNKPDAIRHMQELVEKYPSISVQALKVRYPQGGEKQLINALLGREVPSGKLPIEVGCVVNNAGTAYAVYEAVQKNKPLVERVVTVTGYTVAKPSNFLVRIGTPVQELLAKAGADLENSAKIVNGGPMMGKALNSLDVPVVKGTSGILVFPADRSLRVEQRTCIRCGRCVSVCPMGLEPILLAQYGERGMWDLAEENMIMDCIECGSCQYTCPSGRPLLDYIRLGKSKVGQIIRNRGKK